MLFTGCRNVRLEDVRIVDSPCWTTRFAECDGVSVRGITIDNFQVSNSDGLHFCSRRDVIVADCRISTGDDAIAFTTVGVSGKKWTERVLVHHCILRSRSAAVRIGSGGMLARNVVVSDCLIHESNRGIAIHVYGGGRQENIRVSRMTIETRKYGVGLSWWGQGDSISILQDGDSELRGLVLDDLTCRGDQRLILYCEKRHALRDITLRNIDVLVNHAPVIPVQRGIIDMRPLPVIERPLPAFLLEGADDVRIRDCRAGFDGEPRPAWATGPFEVINCRNVDGGVTPLVGSHQ